MSDPYREATRTYRRRLPRFVRVGLVVGGLFAVGTATLALVAMLVAGRVVKDEVVDDLGVALDWVGVERVDVQRPDLRDGQRAIEANLAEMRERLHEHRLEVTEMRARAKRTRATYEIAATQLAQHVSEWQADGLPRWVPVHPQAGTPDIIVPERDETVPIGVSSFEVSAGAEDVLRWYRTAVKDAGLRHSLTFDGAGNLSGLARTIMAESSQGSDQDSRWLFVTVRGDVDGESSKVALIFRN